MINRWNDNDAESAMDRLGPACSPELALRLYSAQLLGRESELVLHGGGNVSVKCEVRDVLGESVPAIRVKASGADMAQLEAADLPALKMAGLQRLRQLEHLSDHDMTNEFRAHLFDTGALLPSIETLLHVFLPHRYVDHSHADAILALTNQTDPVPLLREALSDRVAVLPYVRPGFELAKAVVQALEAAGSVEGIVLLQHGLVTFGDDPRTSYGRHIEIVTACETLLENRCAGRRLSVTFRRDESPRLLATTAAPILRGLLAEKTGNEDRPRRPAILEWRATDEIMAFVNSEEAESLAHTPVLTGDHLLYTKPWPLFMARPAWENRDALKRQLDSAVAGFRKKYEAYAAAGGASGDGLETAPRTVLLPGAGAFCWGPSKRLARVTADINEHTLSVKAAAHLIGGYQGLSEAHLFDMEFRTLQRRKLGKAHTKSLAGQIVMISGGAGAIGAAVADCCAAAGAHVALADLDETRLRRAVETLKVRHGEGTALAVHMDVTDEASVRQGYDSVVCRFGGVDVVVPNAGIAHVSPIEALSPEDFRRALDVNAVGYMLFMREGIRVLKAQGLGGHIIINASKNVFGPGKDFGAYSASKAAGHQLGKVAAIELAPFGVRVNMINADAVFGDEVNPSGLWETVGPDRAKSRNLEMKDLPDYYCQRNLLKARVLGRHVGNAVVFFASNATPTTGATLPVDGGVVEAFPR